MKLAPSLAHSDSIRFARKVTIATSGCHLWSGTRDRSGYGQVSLGGTIYAAHRVAYATVNGGIPAGLVLDHICRNRHCVNAAHLRPVTVRENTLTNSRGFGAINAAKTHCKRGHLLDGVALYVKPSGFRQCRLCARAMNKARRHRLAETPNA